MADDNSPEDTTASSSLWDKLLRSIESTVHLRVVTYVGEIEVGGKLDKPEIAFPSGAQPKTLTTAINLAQGDITTTIHPDFLSPDAQVLRDYHQHQVGQANAIVERNVKLVIELAQQLGGELEGLTSTRTDPGAGS